MSNEPLEILILTQSDAIFLWSNDDKKYLRCMTHSLSIKTINCSDRNLIVLATDGTLYKGNITRHSIQTKEYHDCDEEFVEQRCNRRADISENSKCEINLNRISNVDRITNVSIDQLGESFVVLQENSKRYLWIPTLPDDPITFKGLLNDTTDFDLLHDIVFHVSISS